MADTKKRERERRCLHCSLTGAESTMRLVRGAGWLHDPIEGCIQATAQHDNMRGRHQRDRTVTAAVPHDRHTPPRSHYVDPAEPYDVDAWGRADP